MRISVSYLLYAMNKLRLSAYTHTPSGIPKLKLWLSLSILHYFSQVLPLLTLVRSQTQSKHCVWLHSALHKYREKLVVPRRRYVCVYKHIAFANVTFRGKGGTAERVTDFVFKIGTKRSLFRRRRAAVRVSPVLFLQHQTKYLRANNIYI